MTTQSTILPRRTCGRPSKHAAAIFAEELDAFCKRIQEINSTLDFRVSSRGWAYILEEHGLTKGQFDSAQDLINDCRRNGQLPLNICAEDGSRQADNLERLDLPVDDEAEQAITILQSWHETYKPISFWDYQSVYLEMVVEKIDLKRVYLPTSVPNITFRFATLKAGPISIPEQRWRRDSPNTNGLAGSAYCCTAVIMTRRG